MTSIGVGFGIGLQGRRAVGGKEPDQQVLVIYTPGIETASLYEVIDKEHDGTINDPIPYTPPMEIFNSKYYTQNSVLYRCTRDSGQALTHNLADLVGTYVEVVER